MHDLATEQDDPAHGAVAASRGRGRVPEILGVAWVLGAGIAVLLPALIHGSSLGPFDILTRYGLTSAKGVVHNTNSTDQIDEIIPWLGLAWSQVHHGHLPLWDGYNALGHPLAFNWQSSAFSVPSLLSYLAPLRLAFTVQLIAIMAISGTGIYVLVRTLRLGVVAAAFAGTVFELCGGVMGWFGWPVAGVFAWSGWILAAALLVLRGRRPVRAVCFLAAASAAAVYAGQPDALVILLVGFLVFSIAVLALRAFTGSDRAPVLRPLLHLGLAGAAGFALASPLALPALQLTTHAVRRNRTYLALPPRTLLHFAFASFDGSATSGVVAPHTGSYYPDTASYVGVIVLVLAPLGLVLFRRRREVIAFTAVAVAGVVLAFFPPVLTFLRTVPGIGSLNWHRGLALAGLGLAVLSAFGIEGLVSSSHRRLVTYWLGVGFLACSLAVACLWAFGRGNAGQVAHERTGSFLGPVVSCAIGLVVAAVVIAAARPRRHRTAPRNDMRIRYVAAISLLAGATIFLVASGAPMTSSSPTYFATNPAIRQMQRTVGSSLVGFGTGSCQNLITPQLGILQEANIGYGLHQLSAYDPMLPKIYAEGWKVVSSRSPFLFGSNYCPGVTTLAVARLYGVGYVLDPAGFTPPSGGILEKRIKGEDVYRMPGAAFATLTPLPPGGATPPIDAPSTPVTARAPGPASWRIRTDATGPAVIRIRVADVPGWHASVDGHRVPISRFAGVMLQARVPPGRHLLELHYWPGAFSVGLALALAGALALLTAVVLAWRRSVRQDARSPTRGAVPPMVAVADRAGKP